MSRRKAIILLGAFCVLAVAGLGAAEVLAGNDPLGSGGPAGYSVRVLRDQEVLATFGVDALRRLDSRKITIDGKTEEGPRLRKVLEAAGVKSYDTVTIRGAGVYDDGVIILSHAEVTDDVLLDFANRGTVKIVSPRMLREDRVRDVTDIIVDGGTP
ncbi:MAG: hypothetical protein ABFC80_01195 [Coriobacteriales bacterium]